MNLKDVRNLDKDDLLSLLGLEKKSSPGAGLAAALGTFGVGLLVGAGHRPHSGAETGARAAPGDPGPAAAWPQRGQGRDDDDGRRKGRHRPTGVRSVGLPRSQSHKITTHLKENKPWRRRCERPCFRGRERSSCARFRARFRASGRRSSRSR